jgi:hypothetical protein
LSVGNHFLLALLRLAGSKRSLKILLVYSLTEGPLFCWPVFAKYSPVGYPLAVAVRACTVSFTGPSGVRHSVEVSAESVYEAAALGLSQLRRDEWADQISPGTPVEVTVREPATTHTVSLAQIRRWCDGVAVSPDELQKRKRVKALIGADNTNSG